MVVLFVLYAGVAELVDALGLGPSGATRGGSSPLSGTKHLNFRCFLIYRNKLIISS